MQFNMSNIVYLVCFVFGVCLAERIIKYKFLSNKRFDNSYKASFTDKLGCLKQCLEDNQEPCISFMYKLQRGKCRLFNRYLTDSENSNESSDEDGSYYIPYMDIAVNKPTHQSSSLFNYLSSHGVDGDVSSFTSTKSEDNPWWCVDLQRVHSIRLVHIQGQMNNFWYLRRFEVRLRITGACDQTGYLTATRCFQDTGDSGKGSYEIKRCNMVSNTSNITARYIFISYNERRYLSLTEVSVLSEFVSNDCN